MRYRRATLLGLLATGALSMAPLQMSIAKTGQIAQPIEEPKTENNQIHRLHQKTQVQKIASEIEIRPVETPTPEEKLNALEEELKKLQGELEKARQIRDLQAEAESLNKISDVYINLKRFEQALDSSHQALNLYKQSNNQKGEISALGKVIDVFFKFRKLQEAKQIINQSLKDFRASKDTTDEQFFLSALRDKLEKNWRFSAGFGKVADRDLQEDYSSGKISWEEVLEISEFNLFISRLVGSYQQEVESLHGIGWAYRNLGKFPNALNYYNQATAIARFRSEKCQHVFLLVEIGIIYSDLGRHDKALKQFQIALSESLKPQENYSSTPIGNLSGNDEYKSKLLRGFALTKIGIVYINIGQYDKALQYLLEAEATGVQWDINTILLGLGMVYSNQGNYSKALESYQRALRMVVIGDPSARGEILNRIGFLYFQKSDFLNALDNFQKALLVFKELKNPVGEAITLSNIGFLLEKQSKPELAIVFYKESINVSESIRQDLRKLTIEEQKAYTETVANTYRALADLLLSQGRVLEAQQVLELLKIQELRDYTRDTRTGGATSGSSLNPLEQPIPEAFTDKIALGNQLTQCEQIKCAERKQLIAQRGVA